jgi:transposase InsO family protein
VNHRLVLAPLVALPRGPLHRRCCAARREARRLRERAIRRCAVAVAAEVAQRGRPWTQVAQRLCITSRTLRHWRREEAWALWAVRPPGRPMIRSPRDQRNAVVQYLNVYGPGVGLPALREAFHGMARAELDEIQKRYRRIWRERHRQPIHVLHWSTAGAVWAIDFAEAPAPIDGAFPYLLAVRDLASGKQLLWQPLREASALAAANALASLVLVHGPPLVLKSDNGSAFGAAPVATLLANFGVLPLFSPPHTPSYNGAIEAGIGSLKSRTEDHAARHGRPGAWTWDDVVAAQLEANATARPHGPKGPTPDQAWARRPRAGSDDCDRFRLSVEAHRDNARRERGLPNEQPLDVMSERSIDREAIRRALVEHGNLVFSRRRILPPIPRPKAETVM